MLPNFSGERDALFFDIDGTLIDMAPRPDDVVVSSELLQSLQAAERLCGGAIALVSGRTIANIDKLFTPLRLRASGVHGAEMRFEPDGATTIDPAHLLPPALVENVRAIADQHAGTLVEDKRFSVALHYRHAPQAAPALRTSLEAMILASGLPDVLLMPGHMVFEIKRAGFDKGQAIRRLTERSPFAGRRPVFFGDDVTDEPGFTEVLRQGGDAISVGRNFPAQTSSLPGPAAVREWLSSLAR